MIDLENYKWESEEQRKGVLSLKQFLHNQIPDVYLDDAVLLSFFYLIQKDHESYEWMRDTFAKQISLLLEDIISLKRRIEDLESKRLSVSENSVILVARTVNSLSDRVEALENKIG